MTRTLMGFAAAAALLTIAGSLLADDARPDMILIPAGSFTMGADGVGEEDERPSHKVELSAYYIDRHEVLRGDYLKCVDAGKCKRPKGFGKRFSEPDRPVVGIDWFDATNYCEFVGKRLPTEAEWEKAARGTDGRTYPWGNEEPTKDRGCFAWNEGRPCKPGSYPAGDSPYGVADMAGGVWEWLADVYDASYYPRSDTKDPKGGTCEEALAFFRKLRKEGRQGFTGSNPIPTECERVLRGGAWNYPMKGLRSSNRVHHGPDWRIKVAGVRCAASLGRP